MKQIFSSDFIKSHSGCYDENKLRKTYEENKSIECFETPACDVTLEEVLNSNIPLKDKFWFVINNAATKEEYEPLAIALADATLPFYEAVYLDDKRVAEAIQGYKDHKAGKISAAELNSKERAAGEAFRNATTTDSENAAWIAYRLSGGWVLFGVGYDSYHSLLGSGSYNETVFNTLKDFCAKCNPS